jgi:hypothetical protein
MCVLSRELITTGELPHANLLWRQKLMKYAPFVKKKKNKQFFEKCALSLSLAVLEFEPRAYTLGHSTISPTLFYFVLGFFKVGSCKLFAQGWL